MLRWRVKHALLPTHQRQRCVMLTGERAAFHLATRLALGHPDQLEQVPKIQRA
jgi:hypothetical protein